MKLDNKKCFSVENTKDLTEVFANSDASLKIGRTILSTLQPRGEKLSINNFNLVGVSKEYRHDLALILKEINKGKLTVLDMFGTEYINLLVLQHTQQ
tara:strand:- start:273 stop:563 length:291 start_codon:yes stop_codon:yes gene_type:complete